MNQVLVIGGGLAGLRAAVAAAEAGAEVSLASKVHPLASHSIAATGGINVAVNAGDSWEQHAADTVAAGAGLSDRDAVRYVCREAGAEIRQVDRWGVPFQRDSEGGLGTKSLGGSSQARTVFAGDHTGKAVLQALWQRAVRLGVHITADCFLLDLVVGDGVCFGAVLLGLQTGTVSIVRSSAVVLATGGLGQLYAPTTNATVCTGDGLAAALRAGAAALDLEMTQFYPTCFPGRGICVTEETRAHGARLVSDSGERFMARYDPERLDMANRDVLCRAMFAEMSRGRSIFLDCAPVSRAAFDGALRSFLELSLTLTDIDTRESLLPVVPAMHYHMGGIETNLDGATNIRNLFAAGECACLSMHGGNRIGGNSLLETLVMGRTAGQSAARCEAPKSMELPEVSRAADLERLRHRPGHGRGLVRLRARLGAAMTKGAGILRSRTSLQEAAAEVENVTGDLVNLSPGDSSAGFNQAVRRWLELSNLALLGRAVIASASARAESRGAHTRTDHPDKQSLALHTRARQDRPGEFTVDFLPVRAGQGAIA